MMGTKLPGSDELIFVIDQSRCIGCGACVTACAECDTHKGTSMMHLDYVDRSQSTQTAPMVCMHCDDPTCASVCPADAIKQGDDLLVQSADQSRCIACSNCVYACPFGVPEVYPERNMMMKCDGCYDRRSEGKAPMCASVCPSEALWFGTADEFDRTRAGTLANAFQFGGQHVTTNVYTVTHELGPVDALLGRGETPQAVTDPFGLEEVGVS